MPMMTSEQYVESLRKMKLRVYLFGKLVESPVDHPIIRPSLNSVAMTYTLAQMDEYKDIMTVESNVSASIAFATCIKALRTW